MKYLKNFNENKEIKWEWDWEEINKKNLYIFKYKNYNTFYLSENDPTDKNFMLYKDYKFNDYSNDLNKITDQDLINNIKNNIYEISILNDKPTFYSKILEEYNIIF